MRSGGRGDGHRPDLPRGLHEGAARASSPARWPRSSRWSCPEDAVARDRARVRDLLRVPAARAALALCPGLPRGDDASRRCTSSRPSTPGSSGTSESWSLRGEARCSGGEAGRPGRRAAPPAEGGTASPTGCWRRLAGDDRGRGPGAPPAGRAIRPVYKRVDTCAAEFEAYTPYLYSTYEEEDEAPPTDRKKVMILGGGPIRIGQGIEFDYCCVHAVFALREAGFETIMVNCNPETVSTDYDTSRPAVLRAAHPRGRAGDRPRARSRWAPSSSSAGRPRSGCRCRWRRRGCPSSGPRPTPSTAPRTASASPS